MNTINEPILKKGISKKIIHSITPFTLLDYPGKTACILWFTGCNMRCSYCYNPEIVLGKGRYTFNDVRKFLLSRQGLLDAVVISGGECLLSDGIKDILAEIKSLGFLIKIDTNGSRSDVLKHLIENQLVDYVALDFKATQSKIFWITKADFYSECLKSLKILLSFDIAFEVRTTYHSDLLNADDIREMVTILDLNGFRGNYYIQPFRNGVETIGILGRSKINFSLVELTTEQLKIVLR